MRSATRKFLTVLRIAVGIGLLLYVLSVTGGWQTISRLGSSPWILVAVPIVNVLGTAIEAIRLRLLCGARGIDLTFARGFQMVSIGTLYSFVLPGGTGGDVVKLYYIAREHRRRIMEAGLVLLVDRAVALFSLLLMILALALLNLDIVLEHVIVLWLVIAAAVAASTVVCAMKVSFSARIRRSGPYLFVTRRLPLGRIIERVFDALYSFREHKREILGAVGWSLCGHVCLGSILLMTGMALMPDAPARILPFLSMLGLLANIIPITPGGLGVGEAATETLYSLVGFSGGAALILAWRLGTLPVCVIGSIYSIVGIKHRNLATLTDEKEGKTTPPAK